LQASSASLAEIKVKQLVGDNKCAKKLINKIAVVFWIQQCSLSHMSRVDLTQYGLLKPKYRIPKFTKSSLGIKKAGVVLISADEGKAFVLNRKPSCCLIYSS